MARRTQTQHSDVLPVRGARVHDLRDVNVDVPLRSLVESGLQAGRREVLSRFSVRTASSVGILQDV